MEGNIEMVSPVGIMLTGYDSIEEVLGRNIIEFIVTEERERVAQDLRKILNGEKIGPVEYKMLHKNNKDIIEIEVNSEFVRDESNQPTKIILAIRDITERKNNQEALRLSELFFRQSQEAANIGSYNFNLTKDLWSSSDVLDEIFEINKQYDRSFQGWLEIIAEEDREMMNDYFVNYVLGQKQSFNKEYRISRKSDGKVLWVLGLGELTIENNVVTAMTGTIQDITERKNVEIELIERMSELQRFHNITVDRELMMITLKKEINEMLLKLGQEPKYRIVE